MNNKTYPGEHDNGGALNDDQRGRPTSRDITPPPPEPIIPVPIMQFFLYGHLPENLQAASRPFSELAHTIVATLPRNEQRAVALQKLLESKDAAFRALVAK